MTNIIKVDTTTKNGARNLTAKSTLAENFEPSTLRATILKMAFSGQTAHIGCAFSIVELLSVLYSDFLEFPDNDPLGRDRDYLVLSKGHGVMAQYACLLEKGWISETEIIDYFKDGTRLKGLADSHIPGIEATTGSLGHGISVGVGLALGAKMTGSGQKTYVILGDGEINEGSVWEALLFAAHHRLRDLMVIVDANGFQAMGSTGEIMDLGSIEAKFEAFGFEVGTVDGHNLAAINDTFTKLRSSSDERPKAVVAHTLKGYGVSFMENANEWHYTRLDTETFSQANSEIAQKVS